MQWWAQICCNVSGSTYNCQLCSGIIVIKQEMQGKMSACLAIVQTDAIYEGTKNDILDQNSCFCSEVSLIWLPRPFQQKQIIFVLR